MNLLINRYKGLSKPLKAAFWFTLCNFLLKGISFVVMPILTRIMPTDEYGLASVILSYNSIFLIFATFELALGAYQRGMLKYKDNLFTFEQAIVLLSNLITISFFIICTIFWKPFSCFTGISYSLLCIMAIYWITNTPYNCWLNKKRFEYDYKPAVLVTLLLTILSNVISIAALFVIGNTAEIRMSSFFLVNAVIGLPFWVKNLNFTNVIKNKDVIKKQILYSLKFQGPLVFHSLSYYVLDQSDRVMIGYFAGGSKAAFYSVSYSLASVIIVLQSSLNQVFRPWRYQRLEDKDYQDIRMISNALTIIVAGVIVLFSLIVPDVLRIMFPPEYYEGINVMTPVTFGVYFLFLYSVFVDIESYYGNTKYIAFTSVICATLNVVLNLFGIKLYGYIACAFTTMICYIVMATMHYFFMEKTLQENQVDTNPIDISLVLKISIVMLLLFVVISFSYRNNHFRYLLILLVLIIGITQMSKIKELVQILKKTK